MSYWTEIENPSQETLDKLLAEARGTKPCHDCGAKVGSKHKRGCDTARCTVCGAQDLMCGNDCDPKRPMEVWTGMWPGSQYAYDHKLVCHGPDKVLRFDLHRAELHRRGIKKGDDLDS